MYVDLTVCTVNGECVYALWSLTSLPIGKELPTAVINATYSASSVYVIGVCVQFTLLLIGYSNYGSASTTH